MSRNDPPVRAAFGNCICPMHCDCQSPETNPGLVSNSCQVHNDYPAPVVECPWYGTHRNGFNNCAHEERMSIHYRHPQWPE